MSAVPPTATTRPAPGVQPRFVVVCDPSTGRSPPRRHERAAHASIAARLATLLDASFAGEYDPGRTYPGRLYFVPSDTIVGRDAAAAFGIRCEDDLFGGVVPFPFLATKVITHPLVEPGALAPEGWSGDLARAVAPAVLSGFSAFSPEAALRGAVEMLRIGPVRIKRAGAAGGLGQRVVRDVPALEIALRDLDPEEVSRSGVVLEEDLAPVTTFSVGEVHVAGVVIAYHGTQRITRDNFGQEVYGGSDLSIVRGSFDTLLADRLPDAARRAVEQARVYDAAAFACFPEMYASRRNYDVALGKNGRGLWRSGVLEQSWRIGGASGAELAALAAFRADPGLARVRASTVEVYGDSKPAPARAVLSFRGVDEQAGPITKYTLVEPHADA